ncbi:hypothetical protein ACMFMF_004332 [Clarireedia jacksonii]
MQHVITEYQYLKDMEDADTQHKIWAQINRDLLLQYCPRACDDIMMPTTASAHTASASSGISGQLTPQKSSGSSTANNTPNLVLALVTGSNLCIHCSMSHSGDISIYTGEELNASPKVLHDVVHAINLAFSKHQSTGFDPPRFANTDELLEMLGSEGLCAVIRFNVTILASASIIPWSPHPDSVVAQTLSEQRPKDSLLISRGLSYEIKTAITADTPEARGKGLVGACIQELVARLRGSGDDEMLLWVQTVEDQNGPYWRRRGYELVGPVEIKEKGMWGSTKEFRFATLVKRVSAGGSG